MGEKESTNAPDPSSASVEPVDRELTDDELELSAGGAYVEIDPNPLRHLT